MRMSQLFGRRSRSEDGQSEATSHRLLLRAGYVRQHAAGIYSFLHLGLRSLRRIEAIVREEMNRSGAQEILMPVVHGADVWKRTGRYLEVDETLVRFTDRHGRDMVLGMTHEEIVAELAASELRSYRDVGIVLYQIQTKFRDELRPRGGLLRTREFLMKDAYSLDLDEEGLAEAYRGQSEAYERIFTRVGLDDVHRIRSDSGVMGGGVAHEFVCLLDVGEDSVAFCSGCGDAWNTEVAVRATCASCGARVELRRGVEIGNIFQLGTRYGDALGVGISDRTGATRPLVMGSYGIGVSRLLAALVEQSYDEQGIVLPAAVSSFDAHLVALGGDDRIEDLASRTTGELSSAGVEVLRDDRGVGAGEQLADADLIGAPVRVTVGRSTLEAGQVELRERRTGRVHRVDRADAATAVEALISDLMRAEGAMP
jgi:prolyl-tRNA synthetase